MINRSEIVISSRFGRPVSNLFLTHGENSKNLTVLFPGGDNSTDVPTLHYARKAALLAGCDVLSLEYGYRACSDCLDNEDIMKREREDCAEAIEKVLKDNYTQLFFISKSAGHFISLKIDERYKDRNLRHICYTPVTDNACDIASRNCQVFIGTKDKWISKEAVSQIQNAPNVELHMIENAVHSLEIDDDFKASIKILGKATEFCDEYIKRYMA